MATACLEEVQSLPGRCLHIASAEVRTEQGKLRLFVAIDRTSKFAFALLDAFHRERIVPIIPSRADQPANPGFDREAYRRRNLVERLVGKLKQFRRGATHYDKLAAHYLAFVQLASAIL